MKIFNFFIFLVLLTNSVYAQISNISLGGSSEVLREKQYADIDGSPYMNKNWMSGVLIDTEGREYSNYMIRYDAYKERVEYLNDGKIYEVIPTMYPTFKINYLDEESNRVEQLEFKMQKDIPGLKGFVYVNILYQGVKYAFIKKPKILLVDETVNSYGTTQRTRRFQSETYFFIKKDDEYKKVRINKKSILLEFPEFETVLKQSKIKDESDVVNLLQQIEQQLR